MTLKSMPRKFEKKNIIPKLPNLEKDLLIDQQRSLHFIFDAMNFDKSWLSLPVSDWKNHEGFKEIESFVRNILVVNDTAERGIK